MKNYDVIIIGSGPAAIVTGMSAKKQYPGKSILMLAEEAKGQVPCGIPYIFHELGGPENNMMGPKPFVDAGGELIIDPAVDVDVETKNVTVGSGQAFGYDKLIFATGSHPLIPDFIKGYDLENVFYVKKSYKYITFLYNELLKKQNIVIIGGGFIGSEIAEQLAKNENKKVTLIEGEDNCLCRAFSTQLSAIATDQLRLSNVDVKTSVLVNEVLGSNGKVSGVKLKNGEILEADAVIMSIGYKPNTDIAKKAGLTLNKMGAIVVDNYERTSTPDVCAVGDCAQTTGFLTGKLDNIMLASTATAEARVLGYNLFGVKIRKNFIGTLGVFSTRINGLAMAAAGLNDKTGKQSNIDFIEAEFSDFDTHPANFCETMPITCKLYVSPSSGSILGGEAWGSKIAGTLINIIGMAIQKDVTVYELISYQFGTHPLLTAPPTKPVMIKAAEVAIAKINALHKN
ncbi:MAG: FAD-dependent oxidoreductase [Prolixibacteraceae bacterium]|nr:FAD-dependent oxidoreductase [Prolixibacteraceae bacterium]MBN2774372.1 FAD-dependent oxidoreductase [Prolixibacteraceae bacterium]